MAVYLVTGSGGYLAGRVVEALKSLDDCERIVGLDISDRGCDDDITFHRVDIRSERTTELIASEKPDVVVHMAYAVDFMHDSSEERSVNIGGLQRVLAGVEAAGCRQLVATSSTSVYGAYEGIETFMDEDGPVCVHPHLPYARDKVVTEFICERFAREHADTAVCMIRPAIVIGPHWSNFWAAAFFLLPVIPAIDGLDPQFQFIHEDDLASIYGLCIEKGAAGTFNTAADGALHLSEIARIVGRPTLPVPSGLARAGAWLMHRLRVLPLGSPPGIIDFFKYPWVVSNERAKRVLGFDPAYTSASAFDAAESMRASILENMGRRYPDGHRLFHAVLNLELKRQNVPFGV